MGDTALRAPAQLARMTLLTGSANQGVVRVGYWFPPTHGAFFDAAVRDPDRSPLDGHPALSDFA